LANAVFNNRYLDDQASLVHKAILDVRLVCEELLSKRVNSITLNLGEVKAQNTRLISTLDQVKSQNTGFKSDNVTLQATLEELLEENKAVKSQNNGMTYYQRDFFGDS
jgi:hypothetical protein